MARRRYSSSSGGGCLSLIVIIVVIGLIIKILPYALAICACGFVIWLIVKLVQKINEGTSGHTVRSNTRQGSIVYPAYPHENYIEHEVDRQIKEILAGRLTYGRKALWLKFKLIHYRFPWNKSEEKKNRRKALEDEISIAEGRYYSSTYRFGAPSTNAFAILKNVLHELSQAEATVYDNSPALRSIFVPYNPIGDMKYLSFPEEPICIRLKNDLFCIAPCYIVRFKSSGAYVTTYNCEALKGGMENGGYNERVKHVTYLHTKLDGTPDRRYKYNPQQVYYTSNPRTVYDMLHFEIAEYHMKYSINGALRDRVNSAIRAYSELLPTKSFDPVYHLIRLMSICDNTAKTKHLVSMFGGNGGFVAHNEAITNNEAQTHLEKNNAAAWVAFLSKLLVGIICSAIAVFGAIGCIASLSSKIWNNALWYAVTMGLFGVPGYGLIRSAIRDNKKMHNTLGSLAAPETNEKRLNRILAITTAVLLVLWFVTLGPAGVSSSENEQNAEKPQNVEQEEEQIVEQNTEIDNVENEKTSEEVSALGEKTNVMKSDSELIDEALREKLIQKGNPQAPIHLGMTVTEVSEALEENLGNKSVQKDGEIKASMTNEEASYLFDFDAVNNLPEIEEVNLKFEGNLLNEISLKTVWPDYVNIDNEAESEKTLKTLAEEMGASGDIECEFKNFKQNDASDYNIAIGEFEVSSVGVWAYLASTDYMIVIIYR